MFEGSLVESTALLQDRNRMPALLSFAVQAVVALIIIAVPMLHPELLPMHAPTLSFTPPPPPRPPQPPPPMQHVRVALATTDAPSVPVVQQARASIIRTLLPTNINTPDTPISAYAGPRMGDSSSVSALGIAATGSPNVTVAPAPAAHVGAYKVSGGVTQGLLLAPIRPEYPAIARTTRTEGTVIVRAIISSTGRIERAEVQSGPVMLQEAALRAVEQARYKPFLLNGEPTEVDTTVTIVFRLGS